jgi:hypothetical protein
VHSPQRTDVLDSRTENGAASGFPTRDPKIYKFGRRRVINDLQWSKIFAFAPKEGAECCTTVAKNGPNLKDPEFPLSQQKLTGRRDRHPINLMTEIPLKIPLIKRQQPLTLCGKRGDHNRPIFPFWKDQGLIEHNTHGNEFDSGRNC